MQSNHRQNVLIGYELNLQVDDMAARKPLEMIRARPASDGDGVKLLRIFGGPGPERFDPFLMLDEFGSNEASDYIGGFPTHPHRGFETITYMLQGKMEHQDHMGNVGLLNDGDVQWMTAGRGILHSEMPRQTEGRMRGFQLWLNLPASTKMQPAHYKDVAAADLPHFDVPGAHILALAGKAEVGGVEVQGYFDRPDTLPLYWDIHLHAHQALSIPVPEGHNCLLYVYEGLVELGTAKVPAQHLLRLNQEGVVEIRNTTDQETRLLLIAGKPLKEPVVQYGPFVMNTVEEIEQAITDYRNGTLASTV